MIPARYLQRALEKNCLLLHENRRDLVLTVLDELYGILLKEDVVGPVRLAAAADGAQHDALEEEAEREHVDDIRDLLRAATYDAVHPLEGLNEDGAVEDDSELLLQPMSESVKIQNAVRIQGPLFVQRLHSLVAAIEGRQVHCVEVVVEVQVRALLSLTDA
eukprot:CAMPEP_0204081780 /NCGR_PEP_ID=MMETSP0360-20130528/176038_1 /ASSEMBLY_ACC=CAM_ASM_000342 /TAXON_ID=268821 /ORGANISM="Scrippsiella Hangoei, Strain SHTV-5" /LENGTH=160 /DNA_ID=CAMNT_0051030627 /DNA_START=26 /DNA_END=508 /DNA_ORIENTATION=+